MIEGSESLNDWGTIDDSDWGSSTVKIDMSTEDRTNTKKSPTPSIKQNNVQKKVTSVENEKVHSKRKKNKNKYKTDDGRTLTRIEVEKMKKEKNALIASPSKHVMKENDSQEPTVNAKKVKKRKEKNPKIQSAKKVSPKVASVTSEAPNSTADEASMAVDVKVASKVEIPSKEQAVSEKKGKKRKQKHTETTSAKKTASTDLVDSPANTTPDESNEVAMPSEVEIQKMKRKSARDELRFRLNKQLNAAEFRFINEKMYRAQNSKDVLDNDSAKIYHEGSVSFIFYSNNLFR